MSLYDNLYDANYRYDDITFHVVKCCYRNVTFMFRRLYVITGYINLVRHLTLKDAREKEIAGLTSHL